MSSSTVLLLILFALVVVGVLVFNKLVALKNRFKNAFSQIDVQLQRRYELIPNLVEVARGYMEHEQETLLGVTEARNNATEKAKAASAAPEDAGLVNALAGAEKSLSSAMGRLNLVMEAYPDLKADQRMQDLHDELTTTDNRIAFSRQAYSDAVMRYNTYREQFPGNLLAGILSFAEADLFELEETAAREAVKVSFA